MQFCVILCILVVTPSINVVALLLYALLCLPGLFLSSRLILLAIAFPLIHINVYGCCYKG